MENSIHISELIESSNLDLIEPYAWKDTIKPIHIGVNFGGIVYKAGHNDYKIGDEIMYFDDHYFKVCKVKIIDILYSHFLKETYVKNKQGEYEKQYYILKELCRIEIESDLENQIHFNYIYENNFRNMMTLEMYNSRIKSKTE